ncbi:MAG TPA: DUF3131 domain-containing protein [Nakamurella sp.]
MELNRRALLIGGAAVAATGVLGGSGAIGGIAHAAPTATALPPPSRTEIRRWARDTWASMVAMTDERTGLTADNIDDAPLSNPNRSGYTSPTNIGGYMWSAIVARELGLISKPECSSRIRKTLRTLLTMRHHQPSGMYYNWYDEATGEVLTTWPTDGNPVYPFLSSVDNGWLAAALIVVQNADRPTSYLAQQISDRMNFAVFYNPDARPDLQVGLLRGGFWDGVKPPNETSAVEGNYLGSGPNVWYTGFHYDTTVSETRIASYIAIARGQVPAKHYFGTWRTFPDVACDWSWQEQRPVGVTRNYLGIDVFEGASPTGGCGSCPAGAGPCSRP